MSTPLTPGQHALLETELQLSRRRVESALGEQLEWQDRVTHASELLALDPHDAREHEADRELDLGRSDHLMLELREIDDALVRLSRPDYGRCSDCGAGIPFTRLLSHPQARRCFECQHAIELLR